MMLKSALGFVIKKIAQRNLVLRRLATSMEFVVLQALRCGLAPLLLGLLAWVVSNFTMEDMKGCEKKPPTLKVDCWVYHITVFMVLPICSINVLQCWELF